MAVTIYAKLKEGRSDQLRLRDSQGNDPGDNNIISEVEPEEIVTWKLDDQSGLSEIIGIKQSVPEKGKYRNSVKLWDGDVTQNKDGSWTATITKNSPGKGKFQNYMIGYKVLNDPNEYWDDPKLSMKV